MRHKHVHHITLTAIIAVALLISLANPPLVAAQAPEIVAKRIEGTVTVDGLATESVWAKAPAVTIPLSASTDEGGHVSSITVKAVNNGEWLYLLIQWEDPTASLLQNVTAESHPVEEEEEEEEEEMAAEQEDRLAVMWYIRGNLMAYPCMKMGTNGAVTQGEVDLWHWHGARDNPDSPHLAMMESIIRPTPLRSTNTRTRKPGPAIRAIASGMSMPGPGGLMACGPWS
jgi:hypothetical protein